MDKKSQAKAPQAPIAPKVNVQSPLNQQATAAQAGTTAPVYNAPQTVTKPVLFTRMNYTIMLVGLAIVVLGFFLMAGKEDIYSDMKITVAPIVVLIGFAVEVYAILYRAKPQA